MRPSTTPRSIVAFCIFACEVQLKCPVSYISIPVLDKRSVSQHSKKLHRSVTLRFGAGKGKRKRKQTRIPKKSSKQQKVVYARWPILQPHMLFRNIVEAKAFGLLQHPSWNWTDFWDRVALEDFGHDHPATLFDQESKAKAFGISFHGDEGVGKRQRNILILSWSSLAVHGPSELTKFPFAVPLPCFQLLFMFLIVFCFVHTCL